MKEILIFAGTTEGRKLSECLSKAKIRHKVCVATEYGRIQMQPTEYVSILEGRRNEEEIRELITAGDFAVVVDATHPYAAAVTGNIKKAADTCLLSYLRLKRSCMGKEEGNVTFFEDNESCAKALEQMEGNILLTTGSKELHHYAGIKSLRERLYVRVLPGKESLEICEKQGIMGKQILALQGPFSVEMNGAMIHQYGIRCLVTKKSGNAGGYGEKIQAAKNAGIPVFVIGSPEEEGRSFDEICSELEMVCGKKICLRRKYKITLAGIGMGGDGCLTFAAKRALEEADILLGAERMIADHQPRLEKKAIYQSKQIISYLEEMQQNVWQENSRNVVVLFSGDSGCFSGASVLYKEIQKEIMAERLHGTVRILPGISSVSYLASCLGESYQDAVIESIHGRKLPGLHRILQENEKVFLLLSGVKDMHYLGKLLQEKELQHCRVSVGYQLSYPDQKIMELDAQGCQELDDEGLYICMIRNPMPKRRGLHYGVSDTSFVRGNVPMTKEEIRDVSLCKLRLKEGDVFYDIGSGTGSVAVEAARASESIRVFAIERSTEALDLIRQNKELFGTENIEIVSGEAPWNLKDLPVADRTFIGGSGGRLAEILEALYRSNPKMRIVINAVTLETLVQLQKILLDYPVSNEEILQMQVTHTKKVGDYHMMQGGNPVWICSFDFDREKGEKS